MTTRTDRAIRVALALAVSVTPALSGCGRGGETQEAASSSFPVETVEAAYQSVSPVQSYSGTVLPVRKALLGAQIQGPIERLHVDAGDEVREGDLLVELASEQLTQAESRYAAAEKDWERMKSLLEKGAVTEQAFDQADAGYQAAKAAYEMILESARIRAPFDGVITRRFLDEGEVFTLMPVGSPSPAIVELSDVSRVKIEIEVAERERPLVRVGLPATVTVDARPGEEFRGKVERIDPGLDRASRTSTADIIVSNSDRRLMSGMFADVELTLPARRALLVPREALVRQEGTGSFFAYVVKDGVAHRRELVLGDGFGGDIDVLEGLEPGDRVVTAGRYKLSDGVRVLETEDAGEERASTTRRAETSGGELGRNGGAGEAGR